MVSQPLKRKETPERTQQGWGQRLAHGADELFEFERELGAVSPGGHGAVTHGLSAHTKQPRCSPGGRETSACCGCSSVL